MTGQRVLLVLDAFFIGGTETHVIGLAKELMKKNIFVAIAARKKGSLLETFEALNCPIYHIEFPNTLKLEEKQEEELIRKFREIIELEKITLVHYHQTPSGYIAGKSAKSKGIATVFTAHGTYYPKDEIRKIIELSDTVICVSPPLCDYVKEFGVHSPYLVPNGISLEEFPQVSRSEEHRSQLKISKDSFVVVYASRITWAKANVCATFLRACKDLKLFSVPNLHVIIVGGGDRLNDIQNLSKNIEKMCKDSFIHLVGEQENMHAYYSMADCVVGTGRVALEAMASGKPVIAVGNHGYFGIVNKDTIAEAWSLYFGDHGSISPCSRYTIGHAMKKLYLVKDQLKSIGAESRDIVNERFNIQSLTTEIFKIYDETLKGENIN